LAHICGTLKVIKKIVDEMEEVTTQEDLERIRQILVKIDLKEELSKSEKLLENAIPLDLEKSKSYKRFAIYKIKVNSLLMKTETVSVNFQDMKPKLMKLLTEIKNIDGELTKMVSDEYENSFLLNKIEDIIG